LVPHLEHTGDTARLQFENHRFFNDLLVGKMSICNATREGDGVKLSASGSSSLLTGDEAQRELLLEFGFSALWLIRTAIRSTRVMSIAISYFRSRSFPD